MKTKGGLLFLRAQTEMHPGSGESRGAIDMAIQREVHTQWPTIQSTSLKGVLRDTFRRHQSNGSGAQEQTKNDPLVTTLFGPARIGNDSDASHAGCLIITDARILAFPVSAGPGVFAWVTCRAVVERLRRDFSLSQGVDMPDNLYHLSDSNDAIITSSKTGLAVSTMSADGERIPLRDVVLHRVKKGEAELEAFANWLAINACGLGGEETSNIFDPRTRLVQVSEDVFQYLTCYGTHVVSRNRLNPATRTVQQGALFMQELLPSETLFYSVVLAEPPRTSKNDSLVNGAAEAYGHLTSLLTNKIIQIGADETSGKGFCEVRFLAEGRDTQGAGV